MGKIRTLHFFTVFLSVLSIFSCVPVDEKVDSPFDISFDHDAVRHIYDLQQRQEKDSLLSYINHDDPSVRYAVARAFASYHDTTVLQSLLPLLMDENGQVRAMAAEAVGIIGSPAAEAQLAAAFDGRDSARLY